MLILSIEQRILSNRKQPEAEAYIITQYLSPVQAGMAYGKGYPDVLSEKAKGKQRAVDPPADIFEAQTSSSISQPQESSRDLVVRFTEGSPDLTISVEKDDTVRHIKRRVSLLIRILKNDK